MPPTTEWSDELNRFVAACERHPDHAEVPWQHHHAFFLRRDITTGTPKEAVVWAVWMGAFKELHTWPWTAAGLTQAQAWCDEHHAIWWHSHFPVRPGSLAVHADAT